MTTHTGDFEPIPPPRRRSGPAEPLLEIDGLDLFHAPLPLVEEANRPLGLAADASPVGNLPPKYAPAVRLVPQGNPSITETVRFKPRFRPPMALVCLFDDGSEEGEWFRLRGDRCVIGRTEGEIRIPHDEQIAPRHAELARVRKDGSLRWYITDLRSEFGVFVRVGTAVLRVGQQLLLGSGRWRYELDERGHEVLRQIDGERFFVLHGDRHQFGRDGKRADFVVADDALIEPFHCTFRRDTHGKRHIDAAPSLNGSWLKVQRLGIDETAQFQIGEQRFLVKVL